MERLKRRQLEIVQFAAQVYHLGLGHKGINGALYENKLIKFLREDIPELDFFKGQIKTTTSTSPQYDVIVCKKGTPHSQFLSEVDPLVNIVDEANCLAVIELKKWATPKMITPEGSISNAYRKFKDNFPHLSYLFVCLRFKDRKRLKERNWKALSTGLLTDGNFCFFGNVDNSDSEWEFPWSENVKLIKKNETYLGEYGRLIEKIKIILEGESSAS